MSGERRNDVLKTLEQKNENSVFVDGVYPHTDDPNFNVKLFSKKEFQDIAYKKKDEDFDILVEESCRGFELSPHQLFVKQLISSQTPYNSLLLYHGLGSGKTCSAIGISEEMRDYMRYMGIKKKIYVLASSNVQDNFKRQLFDEGKLEIKDGIYNLRSCVGNKLIDEINPANIRSIKPDMLKSNIKQLIHKYYKIMGYLEFANEVERSMNNDIKAETDVKKQQQKEAKWIETHFSDTMLIIDEVHNIRELKESGGEDNVKKIQMILKKVAAYSRNMKLIILSATPMYNDVKEIVWILNMLRLNDGKSRIKVADIFDKEGALVKDGSGQDVGKKRLENLARGYVSFVRGEDPFSFPYRIFPSLFDKESSILHIEEYPSVQMDNNAIDVGLQFIDVYLNTMSSYQSSIYSRILQNLRETIKREQKLNYQQLRTLIQALNIVYPSKREVRLETRRLETALDEDRPALSVSDELISDEVSSSGTQSGGNSDDDIPMLETLPENIKVAIGSKGLKQCMTYNEKNYSKFKYKQGIPAVFSKDELPKYSAKIARIMECIKKSVGIVLIYSEYIEGGCIPIGLALEEAGIGRYQIKKETPLFEKEIPSRTMKYGTTTFRPKYVMITGNKELSPDNAKAVQEATTGNEYGQKIKVIIISRSGAEGIDFNSIRQVHILEPWYNMSRIEQIIGRGVRFCSHKTLPFVERNVEIYLHGTRPFDDTEPADLYMYRQAEHKAVRMGEVSRVLKETAVDCLLNLPHNIKAVETIGKKINIQLGSNKEIEYEVGDKPYTSLCDYMDTCSYVCKPDLPDEFVEMMDTYTAKHMNIHLDKIVLRIKYLFRQRFVYGRKELETEIKRGRDYSSIQIQSAIDYMLEGNEYLIDMTGRGGKLIAQGKYYYFKPNEYVQNEMPLYERRLPYRYMPSSILLRQTEKKVKVNIKEVLKTIELGIEKYTEAYDTFKDTIDVGDIDTIINDAAVEQVEVSKKLDLFNYGIKTRDELIYGYIQRKLINGKYLLVGGIGTNLIESIKQHKSLYVLEGDVFIASKQSEHNTLKSILSEKYNKREKTFNRHVGMIYHQKGGKSLLFKIRDIKEQTSTGANVQQMMYGSSKSGILSYYHQLVDEDTYREIKELKPLKSLAVHFLELLYRYNQSIQKDGKEWFLTYEEALYTDIEHRKAKPTEIE